VLRDQVGQEGPAQHGQGQGIAPAVPEVVEHRPDHRREQHEREHRDQQVERDPAARLTGRHREEDRPGEAQGDQGVPGAGGRVQVEQPQHAGLAAAALAPGVGHVAAHEPPGADAADGHPARRTHGGARRSAERSQQGHAHHPEP
jgi:hypothetical protein